MRLDDGKDIHCVKSAWSILHSELKAHILHPFEENKKGNQTNILNHMPEMRSTYWITYQKCVSKLPADSGILLKIAQPFENAHFSV